MCSRAWDLYHNRSSAARALLRNAPYLLPAPLLEAMEFSVEMILHEKPFAVHQIWRALSVNSTAELEPLFNNCPEFWELLPTNVLNQRWKWKKVKVLCAEGRR